MRVRTVAMIIAVLCLGCGLAHPLAAQTADAFSDSGADPVKLFEQGQNAHARGDSLKDPNEKVQNYERALEFYDEAIKVRPEFPEAEFQRGNVLAVLGRAADAESSFRRAIELRKNWALPYSALGALLSRLNRDKEAEPLLREAIRLDVHDLLATRVLANIRLSANDPKEALQLATRVTNESDAGAAIWFVRALAERATGDQRAALTSLNHVLQLEPKNFDALLARAAAHIAEHESPLEDLKAAELLATGDKQNMARLAAAYENAGRQDDAIRIAKAGGLVDPQGANSGNVIGTEEEIKLANSDDPDQSREALEKLLVKNPNNAKLLARLGNAYRTVDATRAASFYRRALELEPANADFATGYSSALVRARRFADAVMVLRKVIAAAPDNYAAHANLATALYELKQFPQALLEYDWLLQAKPDLTVAYYFIATAHDNLGEYEQALVAYQTFLAHADPNMNQLEIEKVKLRLPSLQRQIKLGEGVKKKSVKNGKP
ncbi:MAG TPA: tetratricopeptide repeat protein [Pyrinomonadaceae bacterium]|nr:tetratricopeptide repeat protein [Pyrinomonadaceae bacterium]